MTFSNQSDLAGHANTSQETSAMRTGKGNENCPADLIHALNTEKVLKFKSENGASFVRAESRDGKITIRSISSLQGENMFRGADIIKIEAGIMHENKFQLTASHIKILTVKKESVESKPTTENNMAKKTKTEKKVKIQKVGKIAFVDELLLAGKHTKPEVASQLSKKFSVPEKTASNTVSWAASTMKKRNGKESKHMPNVSKAEVKKPTKKAAAKKKVATETALV